VNGIVRAMLAWLAIAVALPLARSLGLLAWPWPVIFAPAALLSVVVALIVIAVVGVLTSEK
jgi:hypothetical protein